MYRFLISVFAVFSWSSYCFSSYMIDCDFKDGRYTVVSFNTKTQCILRYEIANKTGAKASISALLNDVDQSFPFTVEFTDLGNLTLTASGSVSIPDDSYNLVLMSSGQIKACGFGCVTQRPYLGRSCWTLRDIECLKPAAIKALVPAVKREAKSDFVITDDSKKGIHYLGAISSASKGELGELITRMTMYSFGYFGLESIYGSNNGLDGIFINGCRDTIFLTQSKAGDSNPRAPTVMKKELNEPHVHERLMIMKASGKADLQQSCTMVLGLLKTSPQNVFKMAQCVLDSGKAQLLINSFDVTKLPKKGVELYNTACEEKVRDLRLTLNAYCETPRDQVALLLATVDKDKVSLPDMLELVMKAYKADEATTSKVLEQIKNDN